MNYPNSKVISKYLDYLSRYPFRVLSLAIVLLLMLASQIPRLSIESDYEVYFDGDNDRLIAYYDIDRYFGKYYEMKLVFKPKQGNIKNRQFLEFTQIMTEQLWLTPYVNRVASITNFSYIQATADSLETEPLFEELELLNDREIEKRWRYALKEPLLINNLISESADHAGINVSIILPENNRSLAAQEVTEYLKRFEVEIEEIYPDIEVYPTGSLLINEAFLNESTVGLLKLLAIGICIMFFYIAVIYRSMVGAVVSILCVFASVISMLGMIALLGVPVSVSSPSALVLCIAISVVNSVHLLTSFYQQYRQGLEKNTAIHQAVTNNARPVILAVLTTVIGFACLNFSDIPPSRYMGSTAAIGTGLSLFFNLTLLPALLLLILPSYSKSIIKSDFLVSIVNRISEFIILRIWPLNACFIVLFVICCSFVTANKIDNNMLKFFDQDAKIRSDTQYIMDHIAPFYTVNYALGKGSTNSVSSLAYLEVLQDFHNWLDQQSEVIGVISILHTIKRVNQAMEGGDSAHYEIPRSDDISAQSLFLYQITLPYGFDMSNQIDNSKSHSKVVIAIEDLSNIQLMAFEDRLIRWTEANIPADMRSDATGAALIFAHIWNDTLKSNLQSVGIAIFAIWIVIAIALGSIKIGLLSILPNLLPIIMAFGVWGLVDGSINAGSSVVAVIAFGIVVDDSIHILSRYSALLKSHPDWSIEMVLKQTLVKVMPALTNTSFVLALGFGVLMFSDYIPNSSMGLLTGITIVCAYLFDFTLLPLLILISHKLRFPKYAMLNDRPTESN